MATYQYALLVLRKSDWQGDALSTHAAITAISQHCLLGRDRPTQAITQRLRVSQILYGGRNPAPCALIVGLLSVSNEIVYRYSIC